MSETLSGVTQLKIGDICLLYIYIIYIYMVGRTYVIVVLLCLLGGQPCPHSPLNGFLWFINLYPYRQLFTHLN